MVKGEKCWIIENGSQIAQAEILSFSGNLCLIRLALGAALPGTQASVALE